jgi:hypothetical protein
MTGYVTISVADPDPVRVIFAGFDLLDIKICIIIFKWSNSFLKQYTLFFEKRLTYGLARSSVMDT